MAHTHTYEPNEHNFSTKANVPAGAEVLLTYSNSTHPGVDDEHLLVTVYADPLDSAAVYQTIRGAGGIYADLPTTETTAWFHAATRADSLAFAKENADCLTDYVRDAHEMNDQVKAVLGRLGQLLTPEATAAEDASVPALTTRKVGQA